MIFDGRKACLYLCCPDSVEQNQGLTFARRECQVSIVLKGNFGRLAEMLWTRQQANFMNRTQTTSSTPMVCQTALSSYFWLVPYPWSTGQTRVDTATTKGSPSETEAIRNQHEATLGPTPETVSCLSLTLLTGSEPSRSRKLSVCFLTGKTPPTPQTKGRQKPRS